MSILTARGLYKSFQDNRPAVDHVSFSAQAGEMVVLLGESGSGKTTLLKMINRLIEPTSGTVHVKGENICRVDPVRLRRSIGYVFQGIGLFPHMTVAENVGITPRLLGWDQARITRRVDELLELVHLPPGEYRSRMPEELSGGQEQRVGFARALAAGPSVMLLDEPFGALDPITRDKLQQEFAQIHGELGLTAVLVTHDVTEALLMADRIIVLRRGKILQDGRPHQLLTAPEDPYVQSLMATPRRQIEHYEAVLESDTDLRVNDE